MKNSRLLLLSALCFCASCGVFKKSTYEPGKKYSPEQLRQDFSILWRTLQANHPSLYWYTPKDSVDYYFNNTLNSLTDSLTETRFRNRVAWAINKIHCGHTTVRPSERAVEFSSKISSPQFPLLIKVWDDSAVVISNLLRRDLTIKRGTIITAINGRTPKTITDSICQLIGSDGYSNNFKYQVISFNFPAFYKNTFGLDSQQVINYLDSTGHPQQAVLKNYFSKADTTNKPGNKYIYTPSRRQLHELRLSSFRNLKTDTSLNAAFISLNTFSDGKLYRFYRKTFRQIREQHIQNLVVDLRLNTGGSVLACTRFSEYLIDKPFHVADTVAAISRSFQDKKYIKPWLIYWLSMHISGRKYKSDNRIHFRYFEKHLFKPVKKNHFDGNIYLVTGGYTFSAATLVTDNLKGQQNVTVVGEETGGGAYGNTSMHLTNITLPNTGVRVVLPLFRIVLNENLPKNGRGISPDVEVKPSSVYLKNSVDAKLEKVKELIKKKNKTANSNRAR